MKALWHNGTGPTRPATAQDLWNLAHLKTTESIKKN